MAIMKGYRFPIDFGEAFPRGLVLMGDVRPDNEYQTREDRSAGRPVRQRVDERTGKRQWTATVTDPDELNAKRASFQVTLLADVQPVPTTVEVLPGIRPIELDGLTAEPRVTGTGEFKYQSYAFRATGFRQAGSSAGGGASSGAHGGTSGSRPARAAGGDASEKAA